MEPRIERMRQEYTGCVCRALGDYVFAGRRYHLRTLGPGEVPGVSVDAPCIVFAIDEWDAFIELLDAETRVRWPGAPQ